MTDLTPPIAALTTLANRVWLSAWMIHSANHLRAVGDRIVKVGGLLA